MGWKQSEVGTRRSPVGSFNHSCWKVPVEQKEETQCTHTGLSWIAFAEKCYKLWIYIILRMSSYHFILNMTFYIIGTIQPCLKLQNASHILITAGKSAWCRNTYSEKGAFVFSCFHSLATPTARAKDQILAGNNCCADSTWTMCEHILISFLLLPGLSRARWTLVLCGEFNYPFIILRWRERKFYTRKQEDQLGFSVRIVK